MEWFELCENPRAVSACYDDPPRLDDVLLREVELMHGSPSVHLWLELPRPPDRDWQGQDVAAVVPTLMLGFWKAAAVEMHGWGAVNRGAVRLTRRGPQALRFAFESAACCLSGVCDFAMIEAIRPAKQGAETA